MPAKNKDTQRLDWLMERLNSFPESVNKIGHGFVHQIEFTTPMGYRGIAAIDAAILASKKRKKGDAHAR